MSTQLSRLVEEVVGIPSVTGAECRTYEWLLRRFVDGKKSGPLRARFVGRGQLLLEWTGAPESPRRTVIVVHVDREGFLVSGRAPGGDQLLIAAACGRQPVEPERRGANITIVATRWDSLAPGQGTVMHERRATGTIRTVIADPIPSRSRVLIALDEAASPAALAIIEALEEPAWTVTAHYRFVGPRGPLEYCLDAESGEIQGWALDNALGVVVGATVLDRLCETYNRPSREPAPCNVSVLFTSGEEEGFTGIINLIRAESHQRDLLRSTEVLWLVIDCSSAQDATVMTLDEWCRERLPTDDSPFPQPHRCPVAVRGTSSGVDIARAVPRVEDRASLFDSAAARLLVQAAAHQTNDRPNVGVFTGGFCEAGVLIHLPDLMRSFGAPTCPASAVGCLAIPIRNFRARQVASTQAGQTAERPEVAAMSQWRVGPEIGSLHAVETACTITMEACHMHMTYAYPPPTPSGFRGKEAFPSDPAFPDEGTPVQSREELVAAWSARGHAPADANQDISPLLSRLEQWVAEIGKPRCETRRNRRGREPRV